MFIESLFDVKKIQLDWKIKFTKNYLVELRLVGTDVVVAW